MGYHMSQGHTDFFLPKEHFNRAVEAIQALHGRETCGTHCGGATRRTHFSWVDTEFYLHQGIDRILQAWRWEAGYDEENNINEVTFTGQKLGDDLLLFEAIAPFVRAGSFIEMVGEDNYHWKWKFDGSTCVEISSRVVYADEEE